jgi:hypothetical protein
MTVKPLWDKVENWDLKDTAVNDKEDQEDSLMPSGAGIKSIEEQEKEKPKRRLKIKTIRRRKNRTICIRNNSSSYKTRDISDSL